ncbi:MAG TPA: AAA family ATPase [Hypericibacter adhaerens]|uniref:ATP-binding protein n=1 Tax=Hypericibacter adhaerens TaxID=2602016 RepID=UPI002C1CAF2D|nr:AAA family ATPase [Hypericibacter adhaerens]HWA44863.1 AAA family ATPase [Hypericibacter adhaerens]
MDLLERDTHLEALHGWLEDASAGGGCIVLVSGEAGIGKTSLLRRFVDEQRQASRVLWGGCEALFTPHPLAPLYDIARQAGGEFAKAIAAASQREAVFNLTIEHLARTAAPTILIFEDVHWADEATLDLIKFLGRRLQRLGVMLILSYRDDELGTLHPLRSVIGDLPLGFDRRLHLLPLSGAAVAALAHAAGWPAQRLHELTCGNPFFITEVLAAADKVPDTVRDAVMARMTRLSAPARAVANLAALVPGKAERWLLEGILPTTAALLEECLAVGMTTLPDGALAFRHELARCAVEESLPPPQRQELHARILEALLQRPGSEIAAARLVHHADRAGDTAAVLRHAPLAAARAASLGAHREAAAHYASALRHAVSLPNETRAQLFEWRSYECYLTDQIAEAIEARGAALTLWRAGGNRLKEGDSLRWLSRLSWFNGQKAAAERYAAEAVAILEPLPRGRELAMAYSNSAQLAMLAGDAGPALEWGRKAIALATALDDTEILSHALNNVGTTKLIQLDAGGLEDLNRSLELALAGGYQEHAARAYCNLSSTGFRIRDFDRANRYFKEGIAYCEKQDLDSWARYMIAFRAATALAQGDWAQAAEDAQAVIEHSRVAPVTKIPALVALGRLRARRGDPGADSVLQEAWDLSLPTGEVQRIGAAAAALAEVAWLEGSPQRALAVLRLSAALAREHPDPWMKGEIAFWSWRCGDPAETANDIAAPFAAQIAGDWRAAASGWAAIGCPYEQAMALADSEEEDELRAALDIVERLEAAPMAGILRRKLRASGVRGISRGAQERTRQNPLGLTNRQMKVLAQLAQGGRNADIARRLFISEKTVDHHVSAILAKLEVRSRGEAAAAAYRLGLWAPENGERVAKK